ncbi:MAG: hypothetical protein Q3977_05705 [Oscillospiraceae bacterium]|nr:hypothetical protein [Oscillospiraceae bacterium]
MQEYTITGIINVGLFNSLLSPEIVFEDEVDDDALWERFDLDAYIGEICRRAVEELKKLLQKLPAELCCRCIEGSAEIVRSHDYSIFSDLFRFRLQAESEMTQESMQRYLSDCFEEDWNAEFGAGYRIHAYLRENATLECFTRG